MTKNTKQLAALGFAGLLTAMAPAFAQGTGSMGSASTTTKTTTTHKKTTEKTPSSHSTTKALDHSDKKFLTEAAEGGMMEVEAGKVAAAQATDPDVKAFGQKMVDDHTKANDKLKQLAADKGLTLPTDMGTMDKHNLDKLKKATGADFDRLYMSDMVKDHKKDVSDFDHASKSAKDSDVKAFAADTLPTLQDHLKMAQTTADKIGASTKHATTKKKS
jgi:putative membrane protein